ncbi:MAG: SDR family oxidoreductase [Armatimonadota bacterium]
MANFLITGGAGFIGSHLADHFIKTGHQIKIIDNLSSGKIANIEHNLPMIEFIQGTVEDINAVRNAVTGVDYVLHHAAMVSVPLSIEYPQLANSINVNGTLNVLTAARDAGVKRVVFASSSAVYGNDPALPKVETMQPAPISPYAINKLTGEHYCRMFTELYGLETVCLRYFNIFGPRQDHTSQYSAVIPKFINLMKHDGNITIYGDGTQSRDFTYVADVVRANHLACFEAGIAGEVFNIACGQSYSLLDLVGTLNTAMDMSISPIFMQERPGDVKHSLADIRKAENKLGYLTSVKLEHGMRMLIDSIYA